MKNKIKNFKTKQYLLMKESGGGNIVSDMFPMLLTIIFCCTITLMICDYFTCIQIKGKINMKMQDYVYSCTRDGYISEEVKDSIKQYLADTFGCNGVVDFDGTTTVAAEDGDDITLCMKFDLPYNSNIFEGTYSCNIKATGISDAIRL